MIIFTDFADHVEIDYNGNPYNVPKNYCVVKKIDVERFAIHGPSDFAIQGLWSEVSSPVTPNIDALIDALADMLNVPVDLSAVSFGDATEATQLNVLTAVQNIDTNTVNVATETTLQAIQTTVATEATLSTLNLETTQVDVLNAILDLQLDFNNSNTTGIDFIHAVAQGLVSGYKWIARHGKRNNLATGAITQVLWDGTNTYTWLAAAQGLQVSSTSPLDDPSGAGAWTVEITGLNAAWNEVTEIVALNGQNPVNTVNQYIRINHFKIKTTGANGINLGIIYIGSGAVVAGENSIPLSLISANSGHQATTVFTVPAGKRLQVININMYCLSENVSNNRPAQLNIHIKDAISGVYYKELEYEMRDFITLGNAPLMHVIEAKHDFWVTSVNLTNDNTVNSFFCFQGFLIDN